MKRAAVILFVLFFLMAMIVPASAATLAPTWNSAIVYFNPNVVSSLGGDELNIIYFSEDGTAYPSNPVELRSHSSGMLLVGNILHNDAFRGSAVVSSTTPLVALYLQTAGGSDPYSPIVYNSFGHEQAGAGDFHIPDIELGGAYRLQLGIQNLESEALTVTLSFHKIDGTTYNFSIGSVAAQRSLIREFDDLSAFAGLPADFHGSLVITGRKANDTAGEMVVAVKQVQAGGRRAFAFEGMGAGAETLYMPNAGCEVNPNQQTTTFAIQNTDTVNNAVVQVSYYDPQGNLAGVSPAAGNYTIGPGNMVLVDPCSDASADLSGKALSAVIRSLNSPTAKLAATGKTVSPDGLATAFSAQIPSAAAGDGKYRAALPYVEYDRRSDGIRTFLTVMNAGATAASDINVLFYGRDGSLITTSALASAVGGPGQLPAYTRRNIDPLAAGAIDPGAAGFLGAVVVESDQPLAVLARVQRSVKVPGYGTLGDDYNGVGFIPLP